VAGLYEESLLGIRWHIQSLGIANPFLSGLEIANSEDRVFDVAPTGL